MTQYVSFKMMMLEVVEVADKYRITITRAVREVVPLRVGQKVAVIPFGERILVQPLSEKPKEKLAQLTKGVIFDKEARRKASKLLIS